MKSSHPASGRPRGGGGHPVGRVAALWRYPVKSMGPEELPEVHVSWHGLAGAFAPTS